MSYDFAGRIAAVTGGAAGIGRAVAERLRDAGATVHVWDPAAPEFPGVRHDSVDVTSQVQVDRALDALIAAHGRIDVLVNNAGIAGPTMPLDAFDPHEWRRVVEVNLVGVFRVCRAVVPHMRHADRGRIVNMASLAGKEGTPNASAYSAAKAGVIALTKSLGKELATTGIRVNCLAPAAIDTAILAQMSAEHVRTMIDKSPMGRLGTVAEAAALVMWLCSDECSFSTGAAFDLSGGRATY